MNDIKKAVEVLNNGGIIIYPTDTAFGIGCRIDRKDAVERLFSIRKRPITQAVPVLFDSVEIVKNYVEDIPVEVKEKLMDKYWPGALTIILPAIEDKVPQYVRGGGKSIGVRIPDNETILSIIRETKVGILGPSANFSGGKTPYTLEDLDPELIKLVDFVVEGECKTKVTSTVIDCSVKPWHIIREGAVKLNF